VLGVNLTDLLLGTTIFTLESVESVEHELKSSEIKLKRSEEAYQ
jgi:hypothetical protein